MSVRKPKGGARASAQLKYAAPAYTPFALHEWPESELRKEYTRLRDIARKRLKRMGEDPEARATPEYDYYRKRLPKIRDMVDRLEIEDALARVALFVRNPEISTVGGIHQRLDTQREAFRNAVQGEGPDEGPEEPDIMTIGEWWAYCHAEGLDKIYPSDEIVQYYYVAAGDRKKLTRDLFDKWLNARAYWQERSAGPPQERGSSDDFDLF